MDHHASPIPLRATPDEPGSLRHRNSTCDVLVVGAGPAGLVTATGLAHHGVRTLVVDRHPGTSPFPKATGVSTRTMEILRGWGLEARVRAGATPALAGIAVTTALTAPPLVVRPFGYPDERAARALSPTTPVACPQDHVEPVLAAHLAEHGVRVRFGTEATALAVDPDGATAWLRDLATGTTWTVRARYVVGADGPRSSVRAAAGIDVEELGGLGDYVAVMFRAPIADVPPQRWAGYAIESAERSALLIPAGRDGRWIYARPRDGDVSAMPDERWAAEIRAAVGIADLRPEVLAVFAFAEVAAVATRLRAGNVFVVGDAAHRTTPVGGIGMNTAVQAAHNLGWKLAWVVRGHAGDALLDSYEAERRPAGHEAAWRSLHPEIFEDFDGLAAELGLRYRSDVIAGVDPGADAPGPGAGGPDADDGISGRRAPHRWLRPGLSSLDLFDRRLTLLTGADGGRWHAAARDAAAGVPLAVVALGADVPDPHGRYARDLGIAGDGAVLVRPDGHVSWRVTATPSDPGAHLGRAVAITLGQSPGRSDAAARAAHPRAIAH
jgi:2-polyprenyl-6-methoxyphenol hydroxylase-like FAD-dependent oxidoreductase